MYCLSESYYQLRDASQPLDQGSQCHSCFERYISLVLICLDLWLFCSQQTGIHLWAAASWRHLFSCDWQPGGGQEVHHQYLCCLPAGTKRACFNSGQDTYVYWLWSKLWKYYDICLYIERGLANSFTPYIILLHSHCHKQPQRKSLGSSNSHELVWKYQTRYNLWANTKV